MALAAHSVQFQCSKSIRELFTASEFTYHGRFCRSRVGHFYSIVSVNLWCPGRNNRYSHPMVSYGKNHESDLRHSNSLSARTKKCDIDSTLDTRTRQENSEDCGLKVRNGRKEMNNLWSLKVIGLLACTFLIVPSSDAADALKTYTCLMKGCRAELARCISNLSCAANIACLETCNNRPDETECEMKCGDLFQNKVVDEFNQCAVSRKKCVSCKSDLGEFPAPDPSVLVNKFDIKDFGGKWYITSGLNPTFDTYDCQVPEFIAEPKRLIANLSWRVRTLGGGFFTRSTVQRFVQDPNQPGILHNHDNEYLHYQDDWYIISSQTENKPDDYIFVYYRGRNDAWDGYGGAVVYTRSSTLPKTIIPELERAAKSIGRDFTTFITTDNRCGPEPPLIARLEKKVEEGGRTMRREMQEIGGEVEKVGKTERTLFERLGEGFKELQQDADNFFRGLGKEDMVLEKEILS